MHFNEIFDINSNGSRTALRSTGIKKGKSLTSVNNVELILLSEAEN